MTGIARIANSYSRKNLLSSNQFLTELILDESFRRRNEFEPVSISLLLNAASKLPSGYKSKCGLLFDFFASDLAKRGLGKFDLPSLVGLAKAFGRIGDSSPDIDKVFHMIGDHVAGFADKLTGRQVAGLAEAFASVECRHGPLLFNLPDHVNLLRDSMTLPEIASVMHGYATLGIRNENLLDSVPDRVLALLQTERQVLPGTSSEEDQIFALSTGQKPSTANGSSTTQAAVKLLEAYSMLLVNNRNLVEPLVAHINQNVHHISSQQLASVIPKCLNTLMLECPRRLYESILSASEKEEGDAESIAHLQAETTDSSHLVS